MHRALIFVFASTLLVGCKIEQTPPEYFDHRDPVTRDREEAADEVQARLLAFGQALNRGNAEEAREALSPSEEVVVIGGTADDTPMAADGIAELLERHSGVGEVRVSAVQIGVGPRASTAWFRGSLDTAGPEGETRSTLLSGVYVLTEGTWTLVQLHLSGSDPDVSPQPPYPGEGSAPEGAG